MMDDYGGYARFYDLDLGDMDADLLMIQQYAARCGSPILELACGTGRVLLPLARQGYDVTGVDVSEAMLAVARRKVVAEGLEEQVTLFQQDMRELALDGRFNLAFAAVNSFMHMLTTDDQLAALEGVRQHLQPGGLLILDLFNPDLGRLLDARGQVYLDKVFTDPGTGHRLMRFSTQRVELSQQTLRVSYIVDELDEEGGVRRTLFPFSIRYLFRSELELLLGQAGFAVEAIYGSYDLDEFGDDSEKMIAVARKLDRKASAADGH
jgi:ubiquinone/menaquinone biosynthesis C-methylase UbiE